MWMSCASSQGLVGWDHRVSRRMLLGTERSATLLVRVKHARWRWQLTGGLLGQVMGRMVRHTELAEKWVDKVQRASHTTPTYEVLEGALQDAEQFMWAGHEMDSVGCSDLVQVRVRGCWMCGGVGKEPGAVS